MRIVPVSLSYLGRTAVKHALGEQCVLDGMDVEMVRFMGQVVHGQSITQPGTTLHLVADALSGASVAVLVYSQCEDAVSNPLHVATAAPEYELESGVYYMFHGVPRYLSKQRGTPGTHVHIDLKHARKVTDMNELTFHGLDCIHTHLKCTKKLDV